MKPVVQETPRAQPAPLLREYYSRVLAYIAPAAAIAAGTYTNHFGYAILWMVPYALLYPHLAHHLGNRFRQDHPQQTRLTLLFLAPLFSQLPKPVLGALIIEAVVMGMMNVPEMRRIYRVQRFDFWVAIVAILATLAFGVLAGVILGIGLGGAIALGFILVAVLIGSYTSTAYHTCLYLWARDVEKAEQTGQSTGSVAAPAPLAAIL